ncbi:MAG: hypothetical protein ABI875_03835, partial [Gemmatimonadales bacterium]
GAVPETIAVILVYRPAAVLFVFLILIRPLTSAEPTEIVRIVVIGKPERLPALVTAWHTSP